MIKFFLFLIFFLSKGVLSCNIDLKPKVFVFFSPHDKIEKFLVNIISNAKNEILIASYNLTSKKILNAVINSHLRGIKIKVLLDGKNNWKKKYILNTFLKYNVPVRLNYSYNIMHNKFLIIDNDSLETGSYNYTFSAHKLNSENIIYLKYVPKIVSKYKKEFLILWNKSFFLNKKKIYI